MRERNQTYTREEPQWKPCCDGVENDFIGAWRAGRKEQLILIKVNKEMLISTVELKKEGYKKI